MFRNIFRRNKKQDIIQTQTLNSTHNNKILVSYATKTGNSKYIAQKLYKQLSTENSDVEFKNISRIKPDILKQLQNFFLVISTDGEGDLPMMAEGFYKKLNKSDIDLQHLQYSICALGDSSYDMFCEAGKSFDKLLSTKKAKAIIPRADCDVEYEKSSAQWMSQVCKQFNANEHPNIIAEESIETSPKIKGTITEVTPLTQSISSPEFYHISIQCNDDISHIQPGDAIEIKPENPDWLVLKVARLLNVIHQDKKLKALKNKLELTSVSKPTLEQYLRINPNKSLKALLKNQEETAAFTAKANWVDVLTKFPLRKGDACKVMEMIPKIKKRLYSVASASSKNELHLTVKTIRFHYNEQMHEGAGSVLLTEYMEVGQKIGFRHKTNESFRLPEDKSPIIMIGIGTGIAPFRGFLMENQIQNSKRKTWLIWGNKHKSSDFLYESELKEWHKNGVLNKMNLAFSRDGAHKKYVQHLLNDNAKELIQWIQKGAHIYVCGSIAMAKDVKETLMGILQNETKINYDSLVSEQRYHEDAY